MISSLESRITTPLGPVSVKIQQDQIISLNFTVEELLEEKPDESHPLLGLLIEQLEAYFSGTLKNFSVPVRMEGTSFQKKVWDYLTTIPYGEVRSYKDIALDLGGDGSLVRAVAGANRANPLLLLVPCHRVIGKQGDLVGYSGGLNRKQALLDLELRQYRLFDEPWS